MKVLTVWIHVLCCVTNCHKLITLKQYKRIVLLSSWLRRPGSGSPGPRPGFSQAEIRVPPEPRTSPTLPGCWRDPVPGAFRAENVSSAHRGRHHSLSRGFPQHGRLLLQSQTDRQTAPKTLGHHVRRSWAWGGRSMPRPGTCQGVVEHRARRGPSHWPGTSTEGARGTAALHVHGGV